MADETVSQQQRPLPGDQQPAVSYLARFWLEPQEAGETSSLFRGYARDLRTGEERYFGDPQSFSEHVQRRLEAARQAEASPSNQVADAIG